jgi:hypothetical protein
VMAKGGLTTRPGRVSLRVHAPISTAGQDLRGARALAEQARQIVANTIDAPSSATV